MTAPGADPDPAGILGRSALYLREQVLGEAGPARLTKKTDVSFGVPTARRLDMADVPDTVPFDAGADQRRYAVVMFFFTLGDLPPEHSYLDARLDIAFEHPDTLALSLKPDTVRVSVEVEETQQSGVVPYLERTETSIEVTENVERRLRYTSHAPVVSVFGLREPAFAWKFQAQPGHPLWPMSYATAAILQLAEAPEVGVTLWVTARVSHPMFGIPAEDDIGPREPLRARYRLAENTFTPADAE